MDKIKEKIKGKNEVLPENKMEERILSHPTVPIQIDPKDNLDQLLEKMGKISFQGRSLSSVYSIWKEMLKDECVIFFGLSGAMSAGGMRELVTYLIENRFIDCLVSTGANLFHDIHESLGRLHFIGAPWVDDVTLQKHGIDRMYDTYAKEMEFRNLDAFIGEFTGNLDSSEPLSTREFFYLLGEKIAPMVKKKGIAVSACKSKLPIYCPAVADSSVGIAIATYNNKHKKKFYFDLIKDVTETAYLVANAKNTAVISVGGGTPKNFIHQAEVTASIHLGYEAPGHKYAVQITTDSPHWGGLSGCTFQEAQSWGKIQDEAQMATVYCDATIALPILVTALAQSMGQYVKTKRKIPQFDMGTELKLSI